MLYNTMRFGTDSFNPYIRQALLISNTPLDLSAFNRLDHFTVQGNEPSGSKRRFMFKMNDKIYTFNDQTLVEFTGTVDVDNVLEYGNTAAQVEAVQYNRQLVGAKIFPIIALYCEESNSPSAKIIAAASNVHEELDFSEEHSPIYFHDPIDKEKNISGTVLGFTWDIEIKGDASGVFRVKLLKDKTWSEYMTITEARGQTAEAIQVKWIYHVGAADGNNSVKIKRFNVHWSPDADSRVYGDVAYIYSITKYYIRNLSHCVLVVRHEDLVGGSLEADVSFEITRIRLKNVSVGLIGNSQITLPLKKNIFPWTLKIYLNGVETTDYELETAGAEGTEITFPARDDRGLKTVTADYMYNCQEEVWLPMQPDKTQPTNDGFFTTRFSLLNPDFDDKKLTTSLIRIKLSRGRNTTKLTVKSTGVVGQEIPLAHQPDDISCDADYWTLTSDDARNPIVSIYNDPPPAGSDINISYSWHGPTPVVLGWSVVWSA